jgi:hypothetical protein
VGFSVGSSVTVVVGNSYGESVGDSVTGDSVFWDVVVGAVVGDAEGDEVTPAVGDVVVGAVLGEDEGDAVAGIPAGFGDVVVVGVTRAVGEAEGDAASGPDVGMVGAGRGALGTIDDDDSWVGFVVKGGEVVGAIGDVDAGSSPAVGSRVVVVVGPFDGPKVGDRVFGEGSPPPPGDASAPVGPRVGGAVVAPATIPSNAPLPRGARSIGSASASSPPPPPPPPPPPFGASKIPLPARGAAGAGASPPPSSSPGGASRPPGPNIPSGFATSPFTQHAPCVSGPHTTTSYKGVDPRDDPAPRPPRTPPTTIPIRDSAARRQRTARPPPPPPPVPARQSHR